MNTVWIELEMPSSEESDVVGEYRAELANIMMKKLGFDYEVFGFIGGEKRSYIRLLPEGAGFMYLRDNGDWFDLARLTQ